MEKPSTTKLETTDSPPSYLHEGHDYNHRKLSRAEQVAAVDAIATAPGVTLASFAHLDEKKILRKMDMRLIPMLALLYLLSFLDRGNIGTSSQFQTQTLPLV